MNIRPMPRRFFAAGLALALAGCAAPKASRPGESGGGGIFSDWFGSGLSPALEAQRNRLADALRGTPVVVEATRAHRLRVEVPVRHAFEPGRAAVKPALGAVLDQLAIGFRPYAATTDLRIFAPSDEGDRLWRARGASVREHLLAKGVPASRIAEIARSASADFELLLSDRPAKS